MAHIVLQINTLFVTPLGFLNQEKSSAELILWHMNGKVQIRDFFLLTTAE
jgi:hypothetical protein